MWINFFAKFLSTKSTNSFGSTGHLLKKTKEKKKTAPPHNIWTFLLAVNNCIFLFGLKHIKQVKNGVPLPIFI